eukprot:TRINITY_DN4049_c0_g1_i1.p1 TRINITY_DN4049_c0_g1~~TRINITY_DN4049_c0_g1_i1.p1  ORF type:complete len:165 (+),score=41.72 TRINITY_DN4049_c0_g1_i1:74-568(+)
MDSLSSLSSSSSLSSLSTSTSLSSSSSLSSASLGPVENDTKTKDAKKPAKTPLEQSLESSFTSIQKDRYDHFRESAFPHPRIKKVIQAATGPEYKVPSTMVVAMSTLSKMFVGDLVEESRIIMDEWGHEGPIRPVHLREAYRRLQTRGKVLGAPAQKTLFQRRL